MLHVVLSTVPLEAADSLASRLIDTRLAACVNVVPQVASVYRWKGAVERSAEALLIIKTSDETLSRLLAELPAMHPYTVPEIVALQVSAAHPAYAAWVDAESSAAEQE